MNDWFEWNGKRCTEYGIHVSEQPPLTLPAERVTFTDVPGRSGSLTTLEGEDVYEDMVLTAQCFIQSSARVPEIAAWLRGSGTVTFAPGRDRQAERRAKQHDRQDHGKARAVDSADSPVFARAEIIANQRAHPLYDSVCGQVQEGLQLVISAQHKDVGAAICAQHGV